MTVGDVVITPALLLAVFAITFAIVAGRYLLLAGPAYLIFWKGLAGRLHHRRIQQKFPRAEKLWAEFGWSISTFFIFGLMAIGVFLMRKAGLTLNYEHISDYGWGYWVFSIVLMAILHDAYFYWTHRFMHMKAVFKHVHRVHHESSNPSPWAAFSFHPLEAVVEFGIVFVIVLTIPYHVSAIIVFFSYMTIMNVLGHLGYELFPKGFTQGRFTWWHNTSTHHNMHHSKSNCNYGLYFNWWDRMMNTNHRDYHTVFEDVKARRPETAGMGIPTAAK